jgi:hypothetical protein
VRHISIGELLARPVRWVSPKRNTLEQRIVACPGKRIPDQQLSATPNPSLERWPHLFVLSQRWIVHNRQLGAGQLARCRYASRQLQTSVQDSGRIAACDDPAIAHPAMMKRFSPCRKVRKPRHPGEQARGIHAHQDSPRRIRPGNRALKRLPEARSAVELAWGGLRIRGDCHGASLRAPRE